MSDSFEIRWQRAKSSGFFEIGDGDTLCKIAAQELKDLYADIALTDAEPSDSEIRRRALELARINHIRDPDRIFSKQSLLFSANPFTHITHIRFYRSQKDVDECLSSGRGRQECDPSIDILGDEGSEGSKIEP
jgi:hypothetical protein